MAGAPVDEPPTTPPLVLGLEDEVGLNLDECVWPGFGFSPPLVVVVSTFRRPAPSPFVGFVVISPVLLFTSGLIEIGLVKLKVLLDCGFVAYEIALRGEFVVVSVPSA